VSLADRMAIASPNISAVTVEATEFPDLARQFGVQGVPRTVVNRGGAFVGALPEQQFVAAVLELAGVNGDPESETSVSSEETEESVAVTEPGDEATPEPGAEAEAEPGAEPASDSAPDTNSDRR
jgi:thioredoxin-like negative regulator of GroEL